jgi:allophanate hydrolase subunit 2
VVTQQSNRIGLRLAGAPLQRARTGELASEGTVRGAVQVPPEGQPVLFLSDHPVTGGYPVIAVVVTADLDRAAQLPPGHRVRFIPYCPDPTGGAPGRESGSAPIQQGSTHA